MKDFSKKIERICQISNQRTRPKQVLDDLIQLNFNLLTEPRFQVKANFGGAYWYEDGLRNELTSYKKDLKAWQILQELSLDWVRAIAENEPFTDIFNTIYDQYLGETLGQFLTPIDVAQALAAIANPTVPENESITLGDPCGSGVGSLILSQLQHIHQNQGKAALRRVNVIAMDLDYRMVQATAVQVGLNCLVHQVKLESFHVHHGNTITDYDTRKTLAFYMTGFRETPELRAFNEIMKKVKQSEAVEA
jgi:type I restriction-modification system DNA methylase subunit